MRTSKSEVLAVFERFCKVHGFKKAAAWNDVGGLELDHNSVYGGWCINKVENEGGGVSCPFVCIRMGNTEFVTAMRFSMTIEREKSK